MDPPLSLSFLHTTTILSFTPAFQLRSSTSRTSMAKEKENLGDSDWENVSSDSDIVIVDKNDAEATLPIREKESTGGDKPATRATSPIRKRKQELIKESDVQHIKPNKKGWITFNASKEIPKDVLLRLEYDRQHDNVKDYGKADHCDNPRTCT